jgi:hypothetical protein
MDLDPKLAARLQELGPVSVPRPEAKAPTKVPPILRLFTNSLMT